MNFLNEFHDGLHEYVGSLSIPFPSHSFSLVPSPHEYIFVCIRSSPKCAKHNNKNKNKKEV